MQNTGFQGGATSKIITVRAFTASTGLPYTTLAFNTAGLTAKYTRHGATPQTITLVTATAGTWTSSGFIARNATGGEYELHVPNAALAAGADYVTFCLYGVTDCVITEAIVDILGFDPRSTSTTQVDLRYINGTAVNGDGSTGNPWGP